MSHDSKRAPHEEVVSGVREVDERLSNVRVVRDRLNTLPEPAKVWVIVRLLDRLGDDPGPASCQSLAARDARTE